MVDWCCREASKRSLILGRCGRTWLYSRRPFVFGTLYHSSVWSSLVFSRSVGIIRRVSLLHTWYMSPLRKVADCQKWSNLDEIFSFRNLVMPEHQRIEKRENIAKRDILGLRDFSQWTHKCHLISLPPGARKRKMWDLNNINASALYYLCEHKEILYPERLQCQLVV